MAKVAAWRRLPSAPPRRQALTLVLGCGLLAGCGGDPTASVPPEPLPAEHAPLLVHRDTAGASRGGFYMIPPGSSPGGALVAPVGGDSVRTGALAWEPVWAPDHEQFAYVHRTAAIAVVRLDGRGWRELYRASGFLVLSLEWSRDGRWIVFAARSNDGTRSRVGVVPAAGGSARIIREATRYMSSPSWSPDGRRIAFIAGDPAGSLGERCSASSPTVRTSASCYHLRRFHSGPSLGRC